MATTPVTTDLTPHISFLKRIESLGITVLHNVLPFLVKEAGNAEPLVQLLFPTEGPLYNSVVTAIATAQIAGTSAGTGAATGLAKFEAVFNAVSPGLLAEAQKDGLIGAPAVVAVNKYVQAIYDLHDGPAKA